MGTLLLRRWTWVPAVLFVCGVALIAASVATGEADVSIVVIFPVFTGSSWMFFSGVLLMIAGFFSFFLTMFSAASRSPAGAQDTTNGLERRTETRYGGVVLIGPVPIAFGSDKRTAVVMLTVGVVLAAIFIALLLVALIL